MCKCDYFINILWKHAGTTYYIVYIGNKSFNSYVFSCQMSQDEKHVSTDHAFSFKGHYPTCRVTLQFLLNLCKIVNNQKNDTFNSFIFTKQDKGSLLNGAQSQSVVLSNLASSVGRRGMEQFFLCNTDWNRKNVPYIIWMFRTEA